MCLMAVLLAAIMLAIAAPVIELDASMDVGISIGEKGSGGSLRASPDPSTGSGQVYKKALDLTIYFKKVLGNFHQYHKYVLSIHNLQSTPEPPNKD